MTTTQEMREAEVQALRKQNRSLLFRNKELTDLTMELTTPQAASTVMETWLINMGFAMSKEHLTLLDALRDVSKKEGWK